MFLIKGNYCELSKYEESMGRHLPLTMTYRLAQYAYTFDTLKSGVELLSFNG